MVKDSTNHTYLESLSNLLIFFRYIIVFETDLVDALFTKKETVKAVRIKVNIVLIYFVVEEVNLD